MLNLYYIAKLNAIFKSILDIYENDLDSFWIDIYVGQFRSTYNIFRDDMYVMGEYPKFVGSSDYVNISNMYVKINEIMEKRGKQVSIEMGE